MVKCSHSDRWKRGYYNIKTVRNLLSGPGMDCGKNCRVVCMCGSSKVNFSTLQRAMIKFTEMEMGIGGKVTSSTKVCIVLRRRGITIIIVTCVLAFY